MRAPPFTADLPEGSSPKLVAADSTVGAPDEEIKKTASQDEDAADDSKDREGDIYADAVLACSIDNPESCIMCSG
jgi:ribonucleoside-diphosphate reductase subunit M1